MTESRHVEQPIVDRAKKMGISHRKMNGLGHRGWPDQLFILAGGHVLWMECKLPGEEPTPLQWEKIEMLRGQGHDVAICDTKEDGWVCLKYVKEAREQEAGFLFNISKVKDVAWHCLLANRKEYDRNRNKHPKGGRAVGAKKLPKAGACVPAKKAAGVRVGRPRSR